MTIEKRFNLSDRIEQNLDIIMRCTNCERSTYQIPLTEDSPEIREANLYKDWSPYKCNGCETVRYYKINIEIYKGDCTK